MLSGSRPVSPISATLEDDPTDDSVSTGATDGFVAVRKWSDQQFAENYTEVTDALDEVFAAFDTYKATQSSYSYFNNWQNEIVSAKCALVSFKSDIEANDLVERGAPMSLKNLKDFMVAKIIPLFQSKIPYCSCPLVKILETICDGWHVIEDNSDKEHKSRKAAPSLRKGS